MHSLPLTTISQYFIYRSICETALSLPAIQALLARCSILESAKQLEGVLLGALGDISVKLVCRNYLRYCWLTVLAFKKPVLPLLLAGTFLWNSYRLTTLVRCLWQILLSAQNLPRRKLLCLNLCAHYLELDCGAAQLTVSWYSWY